MKRFRPHCSGYIVLYVLIALSIADTGWTLFNQLRGTTTEYMQSFSLFSYLITAAALAYGSRYFRSQVCLDDKNLRLAFPAYIQPAEASRAMFFFRQGETDLKLIDKTFPLSAIERYGYVDDLGFSRVDKSPADEKSPLFPIHEVCFLTKDGKRYHVNAAVYSPAQRRTMFSAIRDATGVAPEGSLAKEISATA